MGGFMDAIRNLGHKNIATPVVCPKCGSARIDLYLGGYAGRIYKCLDCGYQGSIVIELEKEKL
jgi:predicted RNA-binding Zn-ribbon protein involved in translation (DUF1610 family)